MERGVFILVCRCGVMRVADCKLLASSLFHQVLVGPESIRGQGSNMEWFTFAQSCPVSDLPKYSL